MARERRIGMIENSKIKSFLDDARCRILIALAIIVEVAYIALGLIVEVAYIASLIAMGYLCYDIVLKYAVSLLLVDRCGVMCLPIAAVCACFATFFWFLFPFAWLGRLGEENNNIKSRICELLFVGLLIGSALAGRYSFVSHGDPKFLFLSIVLFLTSPLFLKLSEETESPAKPDNLNDVLQYMTDDYEI